MMKFRDLKVRSQLLLGMSLLFAIILYLGFVGFRQSALIHQQTTLLYESPLQTRRSVSNIKIEVLQMRLSTRNLMLSKTEKEKSASIVAMDIAAENVKKEFGELYEHYTGPRADLDRAYRSFVRWNKVRGVNTQLALAGDIDKVKLNLTDSSLVGKCRNRMLADIDKLDAAAGAEANKLYQTAEDQKQTLDREMLTIAVFAVLILVGCFMVLLRNIMTPVVELKRIISSFHNGDMSVRSDVKLKNEFGVLSDSFNEMIDKIQRNASLTEKTMFLSFAMLHEEDSHDFFRKFLPELCKMTNSQVGAAFLQTDDKKGYRHYESVGLTGEIPGSSLGIVDLEKEFGPILVSKKIEIIGNIPTDSLFTFHTEGEKCVCNQIVAIPILNGEDVTAIIALAGIRAFTQEAVELISSLYPMLNARVIGVLTYRKLNEFSKKLELQNKELAYQREKLATQSAILVGKNRELKTQKEQLAEANRLKTTFLTNMSHELRTPLNSVISLSGVLNRRLKTQIPAEESGYLEVIERNGIRLLTLIDDILDISRIESGKVELELSSFDLKSQIRDILAMIAPQASEKGNELRFDNAQPELVIYSDADKCRHILQNLIANAVKFTRDGWVSVAVVSCGDRVEIVVSDCGIGIAAEHLDYIFDEFRQADGSTSRKFGGTGLGLSIAKKYTDILTGNLKVQSVVGEGSVFTLDLPVWYKPMPSADAEI